MEYFLKSINFPLFVSWFLVQFESKSHREFHSTSQYNSEMLTVIQIMDQLKKTKYFKKEKLQGRNSPTTYLKTV